MTHSSEGAEAVMTSNHASRARRVAPTIASPMSSWRRCRVAEAFDVALLHPGDCALSPALRSYR
jgi:hypothetical protein